jgi:hypothetical protein
MQIVRKISIIAFWPLLLSFSVINEAKGQQNMGMEKYTVQVLNDTVSIKPGQFAFNSITINNTSNQNLTLGIRFELPANWNLVTIPNASIDIKRGDFQSFPFRISPSKQALGDLNYPIRIMLKNPLTGKEITQLFFVKIKQNTLWRASLINSDLIIQEKDSLSNFQIKIKNNGNKRDLFEINAKSDLKLSLPFSGIQVMLWPGKDTTLKVYVASRFKTTKLNTVTFFVKAKNETIMLGGNVYFTSETYLGNKSRYGTIPLDFEFININAFSGSSGLSFLNINGNYNLSNDKSIHLMARTNAFNLDYSIKNSYFYSLDYKTKKFELNLGSQNMFFNYQINGLGAKMKFKNLKSNSFEVFGLKSQLSNAEITGFNHENRKKENRIFSTNSLLIKDNDKDQLSFFSLHNVEKKYSSNKLVSFSAGYGSEKPDSIKKFDMGFMLGYRVETKFKLAQMQSTYQYFSSKYPGIMNGVKNGSHLINISDNKKFIDLYSESNSRMQYFNQELDHPLQETFSSKEHGLRLGLNKRESIASLGFSLIEQYQKNLGFSLMNGYKSSLNLGINKKAFSQSILFNYLKTRVKEINENKLNDSYNLYYQLRYKSISFFANYTLGPNFYFDYLTLIKQNRNPSTHNISLNYEFKNKTRSFYDRINLSFNNNSIVTKSTLMLRNEVYFEMPKIKSSITFFTNINLNDPLLYPSINISLKKTLNLPVLFKQKYYSASVFLFKDKNNNDLFDKGEEPISDVNLQVNDQTLKTNKKGMIFLKNVEKDEYIVDYRKIQNLKGWIVKKGSADTMVLDRNIAIGVPFKQSRMVTGRVKYELENSKKEIKENLSGILVVATNKKGEMFKSATNENGEFYLNLQEDFYNIQIPTNVFGEGYFVEKSIFGADLMKENYLELEFKVIQRKRTINIKKQ